MIRKVAFLSLHTSPLAQPGTGDAGGMNVYVAELARTLAARGIEIDVFTRRTDRAAQEQVEGALRYRVHHVDAGPPEPLPVASLIHTVEAFASAVVEAMRDRGFDVVHSHYWLSGWAGLLVKRALGLPLANSFHTLGRIKDVNRRKDEPTESLLRISTEHEVIAGSNCVIASTPYEADDLVEHYGADPARLCVTHPGVDPQVFSPGDRVAARRKLGLADLPTVLFVGRLQPLKGLDVVVEAFSLIRDSVPSARLLVVGGPSGPSGPAEVERVGSRIAALGLNDAAAFLPPRPHHSMVDVYRAADVLLVPSRSESFGLVAAEALVCGLPVVAARVGGLAFVVDDGLSGVLVDGWNPAEYAAAALGILTEPRRAGTLSRQAAEFSARFSWDSAADRILELYEGISGGGVDGTEGREKNL